MSLEIRLTKIEELPALMEIFAQARQFMREHGNPNQWGDSRPTEQAVRTDIEAGQSYVCIEAGQIAATFCFSAYADPTYARIDGGAWLDERPYGVIHRIAASGTVRGAAARCIEWCFAQCGNLRIDTHEDNAPMRSLLAKQGFEHCGTIYLADGSPRLAFQKNQ